MRSCCLLAPKNVCAEHREFAITKLFCTQRHKPGYAFIGKIKPRPLPLCKSILATLGLSFRVLLYILLWFNQHASASTFLIFRRKKSLFAAIHLTAAR